LMICDLRLMIEKDRSGGGQKAAVSRLLPRWLGSIAFAVAIGCVLFCGAAWGKSSQAPGPSSFVQGKLEVAGETLKVASSAGVVSVTANDSSLLHTLQDPRLNGREVRIEGEREPDGSFEVRHLFTVHDGRLFRVRYYCHVCNIPATEPGNCVCCQRPTELEEIPVEEVTDDMVMVP